MLSPALRWSLVVVVESLLVLAMLTFGNTFEGSIPLHRLHLVILGGLGLAGWLAILSRPSRLPAVLVLAPMPLLAALAITTITSAYPSLGWSATWQCAAYIGIAWLLALQAGHPDGRRNLIAAIGVVVVVVIAAYLILVGRAWAEWLNYGFPLSSLPLRPLGSGGLILLPTWFSDVIALGAPVVVVSLWLAGGRARWSAAILAAVAIVAELISGTRSVLLIAVVLSVLTAVFVVRARGGRRVALAASATAVAIVVVGLAVVLLAGRSFDEGRSSAYASGVDQFVASPIVGGGPDTYAVGRMDDVVDILYVLALPDAHNIFLTTLAESGILGLGALIAVIGAYLIAIRGAWRAATTERAIIGASLFGLAIVAGHAMGEVVFALIGVVLLSLACLALASVTPANVASSVGQRRRPLDVVLVVAVVILVVGSVNVVRNEGTLDTIARTEAALPKSPADALAAAHQATAGTPESVPAWWMQMLAADAAGDAPSAIAAAERIIELEGFGQEWLSLAVLRSRAGDAAGSLEALARATAHDPPDPLVDLNATAFYADLGDSLATDSAIQLLWTEPAIEPALARGPASLAATVAAARRTAAMDAGLGPDAAFLIALAGEDGALAMDLVDRIGATDPAAAAGWRDIVLAWFGDAASRSAVEARTTADPTPAALDWAWRIAARVCDKEATARWEHAIQIGDHRTPLAPASIGVTPGFQISSFPIRYPGVVWRTDYPHHPYVAGIWTIAYGRPACRS